MRRAPIARPDALSGFPVDPEAQKTKIGPLAGLGLNSNLLCQVFGTGFPLLSVWSIVRGQRPAAFGRALES